MPPALSNPPSGPTSAVVENDWLVGQEIGFGADGNNIGRCDGVLDATWVATGSVMRAFSQANAKMAELAMTTRRRVFLFMIGRSVAVR